MFPLKALFAYLDCHPLRLPDRLDYPGRARAERAVNQILDLADDPRLDPLMEPFDAATSAAMGAHGAELQRLFDELKSGMTQDEFDRLYRFDVLRDELLSKTVRVGFVCGVLFASDPLRALTLNE